MRGGKSDVVISPGGPVGPRWFGGRLGCHLGGRPVTSRLAAASDQEQAQDPVATPRRAQGLCRRRRTANPTVSVVVPTLNEARNLAYAFRRLPPCVAEVVVVDGRSTDDTVAVARALRPDVKVVLERARGKGAALRAGFAAATGDIIVMMDADGSSDGGEIQRFVDVLVAGADFAKGSRYLPGGGSADLTFTRKLGNLVLCAGANLACQSRFTDLCYGYNAFWRDCLDHVQVDVTGFEVETRLNMLVTRSGLSVVEVPSYEYGRVHGESNLSVLRDGFRVLRTIASTTRDIMVGLASVYVVEDDVEDGPAVVVESHTSERHGRHGYVVDLPNKSDGDGAAVDLALLGATDFRAGEFDRAIGDEQPA